MSSSFEKKVHKEILLLPLPAITIGEVKRQCPPQLNCRARQTSRNALQRIKMLVCILKAVEQFRNAHHTDSPPAEVCRNLISVKSTGSMKCDSYNIRFNVPVNFFRFFIKVNRVPAGRNSRSQMRHCDLLEVEKTGSSYVSNLGCTGCDEYKFSHKDFCFRLVITLLSMMNAENLFAHSQSALFSPHHTLCLEEFRQIPQKDSRHCEAGSGEALTF